MSAQTRYGFSTPMGHAGGIVDLAPYAIDTFLNGEASGVMKFGVGVVMGITRGTDVLLPNGSDPSEFAGVTVNNRTTEYDLEGKLSIRHGAAVGVMRYGRVYGRVAKDVAPAYGEPVFVIINGDEAGCFTNVATDAMAVKGRFLSGVDSTSHVAMIELFNQAQA